MTRFHFRDAFGAPTWEPDHTGTWYAVIGSGCPLPLVQPPAPVVRSDVRLSASDLALVGRLRAACALVFEMPPDYPFFDCGYRCGERADVALLRMFRAERDATGWTEREVFDVLIHG